MAGQRRPLPSPGFLPWTRRQAGQNQPVHSGPRPGRTTGDLFRRLRPADHHRCPGTGHRTNDLAGLDAHRGHTGAFFPPCWCGGGTEPRKQRQRRLLTEDTDRIQMARGVWQKTSRRLLTEDTDRTGPGGLAERRYWAKETDHPAWHWLNARNLWRPEFPLPSCLRWLPASAHWPGRGQHTGAGSIVALAALPCPSGCSLNRSWPCPSRTGAAASPQT